MFVRMQYSVIPLLGAVLNKLDQIGAKRVKAMNACMCMSIRADVVNYNHINSFESAYLNYVKLVVSLGGRLFAQTNNQFVIY